MPSLTFWIPRTLTMLTISIKSENSRRDVVCKLALHLFFIFSVQYLYVLKSILVCTNLLVANKVFRHSFHKCKTGWRKTISVYIVAHVQSISLKVWCCNSVWIKHQTMTFYFHFRIRTSGTKGINMKSSSLMILCSNYLCNSYYYIRTTFVYILLLFIASWTYWSINLMIYVIYCSQYRVLLFHRSQLNRLK